VSAVVRAQWHGSASGTCRSTSSRPTCSAGSRHAIARLEEGQQLLRADLEGLSDVGLDALRWTNWGEQWPAWRILWTMIDHDAHYGAEIGCLRDLHRVTAGAGVPPNAANVP
jgi:hypothetical protein